MWFFDTICANIAKRQREEIAKKEVLHEKIYNSFHDDFSKTIPWNALHMYGKKYDRKVIEEHLSDGYIVLKLSTLKSVFPFFRRLLVIFLQLWVIGAVIFLSLQSSNSDESPISWTTVKESIFSFFSEVWSVLIESSTMWLFLFMSFIFILPIIFFVQRTLFKKEIVYFYKDTKKLVLKNLLGHSEEIYFYDIRAFQILRKSISQWKNSRYNCYELNLVLQNTERRNILNHSNYNLILTQAKNISEYTWIPLWDGKDLWQNSVYWFSYLAWAQKKLKKLH